LLDLYGQIRHPAIEALDSAGAVFAQIVDRHELFPRRIRYIVRVALLLLLNRFLFANVCSGITISLLFVLFCFYKKSRTTSYGPRTLWNRSRDSARECL